MCVCVRACMCVRAYVYSTGVSVPVYKTYLFFRSNQTSGIRERLHAELCIHMGVITRQNTQTSSHSTTGRDSVHRLWRFISGQGRQVLRPIPADGAEGRQTHTAQTPRDSLPSISPTCKPRSTTGLPECQESNPRPHFPVKSSILLMASNQT